MTSLAALRLHQVVVGGFAIHLRAASLSDYQGSGSTARENLLYGIKQSEVDTSIEGARIPPGTLEHLYPEPAARDDD